MVEPDDSGVDERNQVGQVGRPFRQKLFAQSTRRSIRAMDFQDK
jgi:hypothetical protein